MKLIVGLGNFDKKYKYTRHNVGFLAVEAIAEKFSLPAFKAEKKFFGEVTCGQINNEKVILLKPTTWMNNSGKAVGAIAYFYKIPPQDIVILFDDADLNFGTVRFREGGSSGGHNGLKSIISSLGSKDFPRIKIGISNQQRSIIPAANFVLQKFTSKEKKEIPVIIEQAILTFLTKVEC
ncbi:aminoacyl-tRNA hydrolase [Candidatus Gracilibacteria bacterium]|nr:aminoacyl-tRNA hydrolase [Candidatus Gracilibacteria bacterium]